jgi:hypothetical protein
MPGSYHIGSAGPRCDVPTRTEQRMLTRSVKEPSEIGVTTAADNTAHQARTRSSVRVFAVWLKSLRCEGGFTGVMPRDGLKK